MVVVDGRAHIRYQNICYYCDDVVWYFRQDPVSGSRPGRGDYTIDKYNIL